MKRKQISTDYTRPRLIRHGTVVALTRCFAGTTFEPGGPKGTNTERVGETSEETDPVTGSTLNDQDRPSLVMKLVR